jgi:hypothetical protein
MNENFKMLDLSTTEMVVTQVHEKVAHGSGKQHQLDSVNLKGTIPFKKMLPSKKNLGQGVNFNVKIHDSKNTAQSIKVIQLYVKETGRGSSSSSSDGASNVTIEREASNNTTSNSPLNRGFLAADNRRPVEASSLHASQLADVQQERFQQHSPNQSSLTSADSLILPEKPLSFQSLNDALSADEKRGSPSNKVGHHNLNRRINQSQTSSPPYSLSSDSSGSSSSHGSKRDLIVVKENVLIKPLKSSRHDTDADAKCQDETRLARDNARTVSRSTGQSELSSINNFNVNATANNTEMIDYDEEDESDDEDDTDTYDSRAHSTIATGEYDLKHIEPYTYRAASPIGKQF